MKPLDLIKFFVVITPICYYFRDNWLTAIIIMCILTVSGLLDQKDGTMRYNLQWYTSDGEALDGYFPKHSLNTIKTLAAKQCMYCLAIGEDNCVRINPYGKEIDLFPWEE